MRIQSISFKNNNSTFQSENKNSEKKFTDNFYTKIRNTADMTDTVAVPRSIFKGYLGFIAGTALTSLATVLKKHEKTNKTLNILGTLAIIYGTFSFVRPYIFKNINGVTSK